MATAPDSNQARFWQRIQGRLILLLLVLLIPTLLIQAYIYHERWEDARAGELQTNLEVARATAKAFDTFVNDVLDREAAIGLALAPLQPIAPVEQNRILDKVRADHPFIWNLAWVSPQGLIIAGSDRNSNGLDMSDTPHIQKILAGADQAVGDLVLTKTTSEPAFTIARAIRDEQGPLLGIVIAVILPDQLDAVLGIERSKGGGVNLVDSKGMLVYRYPHIKPTWEQRYRLDIMPRITKALGGEEVAWIGRTTYTDKTRIMANVPVRTAGWSAGAGRTEDDAMAAVTSTILLDATLFFIVFLTASGTALVLSRSISNPVKRLRDHALATGYGETLNSAVATGPAEIKDLARALNVMAEELRSREVSLRGSEEHYRSLFDNMLNGYAYCRMLFEEGEPKDFIYLNVNGAFETLTGLKDVIGKNVSEVIPGIRESDPELFEAYGRVAKTGIPERFETYVEALGTWFSISVHRPRQEHFVAVFDVITERKRAEEELRKSRDELESRVHERTAELKGYMAKLEQSNQALQDFAAIASHDLQEPLRKVAAFGNMLKQKCGGLLEDQGRDYLDRILNANQRMQSLLMALLEYSRLSTKTAPFVEVSLTKVIDEVLSDLEIRIQKTGGKVQVGGLPVIQADPIQMRQLFQNLVGNGLKFHKEGEKPLVSIQSSTNKHSFQITVEDNGIGFEEQYTEKIFAPFQRLHGRSEYEGTGMGLAICKKIVERHGGSITARSIPGEGSTFMICLPMEQTMLENIG